MALLRTARTADPDPNPGIGGYRRPRGPAGQTGYPGSTAWTRENPQAGADRTHSAPLRPAASPPFGRRFTTRRPPTIGAQQANQVPFPAHQGGLPYQGRFSAVNPARVRDTEQRPRTVTSAGTPGGLRQRNTVYYGGAQARPGEDHTYRSAGKGRHFPVTAVTVPSRYVFGGVNGGTDKLDGLLADRRMPYTGHVSGTAGAFRGRLGHARGSVRGAVLDGTRFYLPPVTRDTAVSKQGGAYGRRVRGHLRHRPTIFAEPASRTARFYDTTAEVGSPSRPGKSSQVADQVYVSPAVHGVRPRFGVSRGGR